MSLDASLLKNEHLKLQLSLRELSQEFPKAIRFEIEAWISRTFQVWTQEQLDRNERDRLTNLKLAFGPVLERHGDWSTLDDEKRGELLHELAWRAG